MTSNVNRLLFPGRVMLTLGIIAVGLSGFQASILSSDMLVAGAVWIAGVKISHSIDQFRQIFEDRQTA